MDSCETCKFYRPVPKGGVGKCVRFPPVSGGFPQTSDTAYCGEFKENK